MQRIAFVIPGVMAFICLGLVVFFGFAPKIYSPQLAWMSGVVAAVLFGLAKALYIRSQNAEGSTPIYI